MRPRVMPLPPDGQPHFASDLIIADHQQLPMVRVLLPVCDEEGGLSRWSDFVSLDGEPASISWSQIVDKKRRSLPGIVDYSASTGELDFRTRAALLDAIGDTPLNTLRWGGYQGKAPRRNARRVFDSDYYPAVECISTLQVDERIPEFAWNARLSWGARLYGDSFVVAAPSDVIDSLIADARVDVLSVRKGIDVMPRSAGD